jgi:anti-sigma regulatory factor (Ser/Thr protein kinase)
MAVLAIPVEAERLDLPFEVASVTTARGVVADALTTYGAGQRTIGDAHIVVGELVMNAVRHGSPRAEHTIEIAWLMRADALRFSVCDGGHVDRLRAQMPSSTAIGGRGLAMVDMLCRGWSYDTEDGTRVTADIPAEP